MTLQTAADKMKLSPVPRLSHFAAFGLISVPGPVPKIQFHRGVKWFHIFLLAEAGKLETCLPKVIASLALY